MPSEDAKPVKKEELVKKEQGGEGKEEEKSLSSKPRKRTQQMLVLQLQKLGLKLSNLRKKSPKMTILMNPLKERARVLLVLALNQ
jgi:hypothetical protein